MKNLIFLILTIFLLLYENVHAMVDYDTLVTTTIGPGTTHRHFVNKSIPLNIHVVDVDLTNPFISIETVKAKDNYEGYERTSAMSARSNSEGHSIVSAINGDFYGTGGIPINCQISNGKIVRSVDYNNKSTIGFDDQNRPFINVTNFSGAFITKSNQRSVTGVNMVRATDFLILYTEFWGSTTETNEWGTEILLTPIENWSVNDTVTCIAGSIENFVGSMTIPNGSAVISGHGQASDFLMNNVASGDTVKLILKLEPAGQKITQLIGGFPRIIKDGLNYVATGYPAEGGAATFHTDKHPRTAVGFSQDSSKLYFVTVDGRQEASAGIDLFDLADFMIDLGVYQGVNLDGGGSTTMVVRNKVRNLPSDAGGERSVANALMAVSTAPSANLTYLQIEPDHLLLDLGETVQFTASGWDEYYNPYVLAVNEIEYTTSASLGEIDANGNFIATANGGEGYVYTRYNSIKDSAYIKITGLKEIRISPEVAVTDTIKPIQFEIRAIDEHATPVQPDISKFHFELTDPEIGTINTEGLFQPLSMGSTKLIVTYAELSDTADISVVTTSGIMILDSLDSGANWNLEGEYIDTLYSALSVADTPRTLGSKALRVDYGFTRLSTDLSWIHLKTDLPVYGVPESIEFDFQSDGSDHRAYVYILDSNDGLFRNSIRGSLNNAAGYDNIIARTDGFRAAGEDFIMNYPVHLKQISIKLGYYSELDGWNEGILYFDNLRVVYPGLTSVIPLSDSEIPRTLKLYPNYPNPFNPMTTIRFETSKDGPVRLTIYDVEGRCVEHLLNRNVNRGLHKLEWNAGGQASGVYIYSVSDAEQTIYQKMVLLK